MNLQGLDAIIFDFDGVLVESVDVKTRAFASLYENYGDKVVAQVENYHLNNGGVSRFDKFRYFQTEILGKPPLTDAETATLANNFSALVMERVVAAPMVTGAQSFLDTAGRHLPLFVVSGTPTAELVEIIQQRKMAALFAGIWGSPGSKADNIAELLQDHGLPADRCIMIGDAIADLDGARANGVHFLGRVAESDDNLFPPDIRIFVDFVHLPDSWQQPGPDTTRR